MPQSWAQITLPNFLTTERSEPKRKRIDCLAGKVSNLKHWPLVFAMMLRMLRFGFCLPLTLANAELDFEALEGLDYVV